MSNPTPTPDELYHLFKAGKLDQYRKVKITPNFTWGEMFVHRHTSVCRLPSYTYKKHRSLVALAERLEVLRTQLGNRVITITSAYRDPHSNQRVGGSTTSRHMYGCAADIQVRGLTPAQVQAIAKKHWVGEIGIHPVFTHLADGKYEVFKY